MGAEAKARATTQDRAPPPPASVAASDAAATSDRRVLRHVRARPTRFEAVCREQPPTTAAAVIVIPAKTMPTNRSRWRRLRAALA